MQRIRLAIDRLGIWRLTLAAAMTCVQAPGAQAQGHERPWSIAVGASLAHIDATAADYGADPSFRMGGVTFPHVAVARQFGSFGIEAGYRKLGVLRFTANDGAVSGHTHSNALVVAGRFPGGALGLPSPLSLKLGAAWIRTITGFDRRSAAFPIRGDVNVWTLAPTLGVAVDLPLSPDWSLRTGYDFIGARLGERNDSGRYRQQLIGLELVRRW